MINLYILTKPYEEDKMRDNYNKPNSTMHEEVKDTLKAIAVAYVVIGGAYGLIAHGLGITTGHVSADVALGKDQPHAIAWRKVTGLPTLEDAIIKAIKEN